MTLRAANDEGQDSGTYPAGLDAALTGVRVLDFSRVVSGPYATMLLADQGAEVIKIESPDGDETRAYPPFLHGESTYFMSVNRNKKSLVLDLKDPQDLSRARTLAKNCDVLIHNFRPSYELRSGLDYETLRQLNPQLIYCAISAYGNTGPYAAQPGYDLFVSGIGGLMSVTGEPNSTPQRAGINFVDYMAGLNAVNGILTALIVRQNSGVGQRVDISLLGGLMSTAQHLVAAFAATGEAPTRTFANQHPNIVPYGTFETQDGLYINVGVLAAKSWHPFCAALNRLDLAQDKRYASNGDRVRHRDELLSLLAEAFLTDNSTNWLRRLKEHDVPCGPINTLDQVIHDPQVDASGCIFTADHPIEGSLTLVRSPVHLSACKPVEYSPPPLKGEHQSLADTSWGKSNEGGVESVK